ncbi:ankyrin repeat-containing protein BDA1-like isoform X2 [Hibiscus syriacus]|uniref:ankyrin repeat-containing protein BDA1-like isoform X2 n=1 Tax=Hibiscus syriacus TaxID=106335 RepID=UPI001921F2E7|nr:ankyrin repeat-containing protein BDA1-like isoform X2 [Hibiscus syriacus]
MDSRLFESALTGNIDDLHKLLRENPLMLHTISLYTNQNPLHIASAEGHVGFVTEILKLKPEYAKEVNKDGFSPLHMAAANGHIEIVRELMNIDPKLCSVAGREKKTPFHFAAMKGRVDVINEMLGRYAECIEGVTVQKETALHLAIKNNQFEAIKVMVAWIVRMKKEDILNLKDEQGNTLLHLATWKKQRQVIELVLGSGTTSPGLLDINATNRTGLTAMDVLQMFPSEAGDREIAEILRQAGLVSARDVTLHRSPSHEFHDPEPQDHPRTRRRSRWWFESMAEYFKFKKGRDSPSEARNTLLVIAVLVATATFQVGLNPPGGTWEDSYFTNQNNATGLHGSHLAGTSIMGTNDTTSFVLFVASNSLGFAMSLFMINILTSEFPMQLELQICLISLFFTYNTAISSIAPSNLRTFTVILTSVFSGSIPPSTFLVKQVLHMFKTIAKDIIHRVRPNPTQGQL